jgi:hypothetical protein
MFTRFACLLAVLLSLPVFAGELSDDISKDYDQYLAGYSVSPVSK